MNCWEPHCDHPAEVLLLPAVKNADITVPRCSKHFEVAKLFFFRDQVIGQLIAEELLANTNSLEP